MDIFAPYIPAAFAVVTIVALLRGILTDSQGKTLIDGKKVVLPLVALVALGVAVFAQFKAAGVIQWSHAAMDAAAVFILAAGGSTFIQRVKDRVIPLDGTVDLIDSGPPLAEAVAKLSEAATALKVATPTPVIVDSSIKVDPPIPDKTVAPASP